MKHNNKGFTLIELLVTISILVAITAVAVVSFIGISNRKKEESWKLVKKQVETAAKEYLNANEYLKDNLNTFTNIPVKTLVEEDYLNVVVNPITGSKLNGCDYVKVTKSTDGGYIYVYNESEDIKCSQGFVTYTKQNHPDAYIEYTDEEGKLVYPDENNWFNADILGEADENGDKPLNIKIKIVNLKNNVINKVEIFNDYVDINNKFNYQLGESEYIFLMKNDAKYSNVSVKITYNGTEEYKINELKIQKDTNLPKIDENVVESANESNKKLVDIRSKVSDNIAVKNVLINENKKLCNDESNELCKGFEKQSDSEMDMWYLNVSGFNLDIILPEEDDKYVQKLYVEDEAGNYNSDEANPYSAIYTHCSQTRSEEKYSTTTCTCGVSETEKWTESYDFYDNEKCDESEHETITGTCNNTCNTDKIPPKLTVTIYKNKNGKKDAKLNSKTGSGTSDWKNKNRIEVNKLSWLNKKDYPDGIIISVSTNEEISSLRWYTNKNGLSISASDGEKYKWTSSGFLNGDISKTYTIKKNGVLEWNFASQGARRGVIITKDKSGNETKFYIIVYMDRTAPNLKTTYGPTKTSCGGASSIRTKYTVTDSVSGLSAVWDYYGYDGTIAASSSNYWRKKTITVGSTSFSHDHNWGPSCYSYGTPGKGNCYKLKYYLKDVAGNENKSMTSSCAKY